MLKAIYCTKGLISVQYLVLIREKVGMGMLQHAIQQVVAALDHSADFLQTYDVLVQDWSPW